VAAAILTNGLLPSALDQGKHGIWLLTGLSLSDHIVVVNLFYIKTLFALLTLTISQETSMNFVQSLC
jgi:hypothetical protein